jgi:hypothetical protein
MSASLLLRVGDAGSKPDPRTGGQADHVRRLWSMSYSNAVSVPALTLTRTMRRR